MARVLLLCVCVLGLGGCGLLQGFFEQPERPPDEPTVDEPGEELVFERHLRGSSNQDFAVISLYRKHFSQSRLVLEALQRLDTVELDLQLPECLKPAQGSTTGSSRWVEYLLEPGTYERFTQWEQWKTDCIPNGTLVYTISSGSNGDSASVPFPWPRELEQAERR